MITAVKTASFQYESQETAFEMALHICINLNIAMQMPVSHMQPLLQPRNPLMTSVSIHHKSNSAAPSLPPTASPGLSSLFKCIVPNNVVQGPSCPPQTTCCSSLPTSAAEGIYAHPQHHSSHHILCSTTLCSMLPCWHLHCSVFISKL